MLALSGGLSWPWVESRYSKHPTGPSSGHSLHRAQEKEKSKRQEGSRESRGTAPPARSSSSAPGASITIAAKAIGELVSCPPPPQPSRGLWMPDSHDPCTPEGALGVPWVLSAATCAEEGEKRLAPGSVSMGSQVWTPPAPFMSGTASAFMGSWGVGACSCPRAAARGGCERRFGAGLPPRQAAWPRSPLGAEGAMGRQRFNEELFGSL